MLSGSTVLFETRASDDGYYPVNVPIGIRYSVSNTLGSVSQDGKFLAGNTEGRVDVYVSLGNLHGETSVTVIKTPTTISVADSATGKTVQSLDVSPEEIIEFVASASFKGVAVHADNSAFKWEIVNSAGNIGSIDQNGVFTSSNMPGSRGKIRVSAGELSVELPVIIGATDQTIDSFEDPKHHYSGDNLIDQG